MQQSGEKCGVFWLREVMVRLRLTLGRGRKTEKSSVAAKYGGGDNVVTSEPGRASPSAIVHMQQGI